MSEKIQVVDFKTDYHQLFSTYLSVVIVIQILEDLQNIEIQYNLHQDLDENQERPTHDLFKL